MLDTFFRAGGYPSSLLEKNSIGSNVLPISPHALKHLTSITADTSRYFPVIHALLLLLPGDAFSTDICPQESAHFSPECEKRNFLWIEGTNGLRWKLVLASKAMTDISHQQQSLQGHVIRNSSYPHQELSG